MKKKPALTFLLTMSFFVCILFTANGQETQWPTHQIKFTPTRMVNLFTPGFEFGYELSHGKYSTLFSTAYLTDIFNNNSKATELSGYRLSLEEKYFVKTVGNRRTYISAEIGYNKVDMTIESGFISPEFLNKSWEIQKQNTYNGKADIHRKSVVFNGKYGVQLLINHFIMDFSFGLGVMFQNIKHSNKQNPNDKITYHNEDILGPYFYDEGRYPVLSIPLSLKIGYAF